jgi:alpha-amylase
VAVVVDDGEKFGLWPGTNAWVHGESGRDGWLDQFFVALEQNASWLETTTLSRVVKESPPRARVYLPPGSYFEMGEWALPPGRGREFPVIVEDSKARNRWDRERPFLRGGFFRNFQAKYPESLLMVRRAQMISRMLDDQDGAIPAADREGKPSEARRHLWRAMCNCSYWHGVFGGLYLPHIRRSVGEHLCRARRLLEAASPAGGPGRPPTGRFVDLDADGIDEVELQTEELYLLAEPARGGAIPVFDLRRRDFPLGMTLTRRVEFYHAEMLKPREAAGSAGHESIHDLAVEATDELKRLVVADDRPRASGVDRFLDPSTRVADLAGGTVRDLGDFFVGRYQAELRSSGTVAEVVMTRDGFAAGRPYRVVKTIRVGARAGRVELVHRIQPGSARADGLGTEVLFATELNLALIESMGRVVLTQGQGPGRIISLSETVEAGPAAGLRIEDDYAGFALNLRVQPAAAVWHYPVRTVSRSEMGYEAIYQGSALLLVWGAGSRIPEETRVEIEVEYLR